RQGELKTSCPTFAGEVTSGAPERGPRRRTDARARRTTTVSRVARLPRRLAMPSEAEARSRQVAEAARETEWREASFLRELFLALFAWVLVHPGREAAPPRPEFQSFYDALKTFLVTRVDPVAIDEAGEYPHDVLEGLRALGAFGMKIPVEYGGLGLSQREY